MHDKNENDEKHGEKRKQERLKGIIHILLAGGKLM